MDMNKFIMPTTGVVTSRFRTEDRPSHHGIDIAKEGSIPVLAIANGKVTKSYYSSSYGNVVFLYHIIEGVTYESVYAHMSIREVHKGEEVHQGQIIGFMGNTGFSTGQHLHFELHQGRWNYAKSNAINPLLYIQEEVKATASKKQHTDMNDLISTSVVPYPGSYIRKGSKGIDVQRIQRAVKVKPDGIFGPITERAVRAYQKRHDLQVDGIVGPKTWSVMF
jgi:peptidoglycan hydrolase-like protein with peptidoglycan-binding domain